MIYCLVVSLLNLIIEIGKTVHDNRSAFLMIIIINFFLIFFSFYAFMHFFILCILFHSTHADACSTSFGRLHVIQLIRVDTVLVGLVCRNVSKR